MISRLYTPKQYTRKQWNKFSWEIQEQLCKRYQVFLIEFDKEGNIIQERSKLERIKSAIDTSIKTTQKGIELIQKNLPKEKKPRFKIFPQEKTKVKIIYVERRKKHKKRIKEKPKDYSSLRLEKRNYSKLLR